MKPVAIALLVAAFSALVIGSPAAQPRKVGTVFHDPFSYCTAVGTVDSPGPQYEGPAIPIQVARTVGVTVEAGGQIAEGGVVFWRCMGGQVLACYMANSPVVCGKPPRRATAEWLRPGRSIRDRAIFRGVSEICRQEPNTDCASATHCEMACRQGRPILLAMNPEVDARGYSPTEWRLVTR